MVRLTLSAATVLIALAPLGRSAVAQGAPRMTTGPVVSGRVTDVSGTPVPFARITAEGSGERVADDSGRFLLPRSRTGPMRLEVRRVGFTPLLTRVDINRDTSLHLVLQPLPTTLSKVQIDGQAMVTALDLAGFYQRLRDKERGANTGHFITPEEIERRRQGSVTQLVTGIPGLRVGRFKRSESPAANEYQALFGNSRKGRAMCSMTVYVNRVRLVPPDDDGLAREPLPPDVNGAVTLSELAGVEVYTRSYAPPEYAMLNGTCGVVLLWTK